MNKLPACSRELPGKMNGLGRLLSNESIDLIVVVQLLAHQGVADWGFSLRACIPSLWWPEQPGLWPCGFPLQHVHISVNQEVESKTGNRTGI